MPFEPAYLSLLASGEYAARSFAFSSVQSIINISPLIPFY